MNAPEKRQLVEAILDDPASATLSVNELAKRAGVSWPLADRVRRERLCQRGQALGQGERFQIIQGDALAVLPSLPSSSVDCVVTSPPYWQLRDYGHDGQLGREELHDCQGWATGSRCGVCYVCRLTFVFAEVRRILTPRGTLWLNLGDAHAGAGKWGGSTGTLDGNHTRQTRMATTLDRRIPRGLKRKDLIGLPWRVAFSLQADGWYLRSDIIWHKRKVAQESCRDRPIRAHEHVFLFARSEQYDFATHQRPRSGWHDIPDTVRKDSPCPSFPIGLPLRCITLGSVEGGVVLDPFAGTATTGAAALQSGRRFLGVELDAALVKKGTDRLQLLARDVEGLRRLPA